MPDNNEEEEQNEEIEEIEETEELDDRLVKSVKRLIKITKISEGKLKGKTLEEQFDLLDALVDLIPKETKKVKKKNKPIVPIPVDVDAPKIGRILKGSPPGVVSILVSPKEVFGKIPEKK